MKSVLIFVSRVKLESKLAIKKKQTTTLNNYIDEILNKLCSYNTEARDNPCDPGRERELLKSISKSRF